MTEPTDDELDAVIAEYRTRIYPQDMYPRFERAIMRAAIVKWGTPPTEQQAAPKAAPRGPGYSEKWDAELGRTAMRFVDRAGDVHPGIDDAETICAEFYRAMSAVIERMPHVQRMTPRKAAPVCSKNRYCGCGMCLDTDEKHDAGCPKAAPVEQNTVPAEWLEQAYREGWAACRDAETIGEEAEDWAFGNSTANSRMIDAQQAAPQQEAQKPTTVDRKTMEIAESVGLIGPASRAGDLHAAIQRFHDLICVNATIKAAAADTVVLEAALRAIHQAIDLIGEPDTERLRTVRRVLRGAVIVAEDAGEAATAPQPAPAPLSDDVVKDAARLDWLALAGPTSICVVIDRPHDSEVEVATDDVTGYGKTLREALDAAIAAQGGKA